MMVGEQSAKESARPGAWEPVVAEVVAGCGLELVKAELTGAGSGRVLRVYVDQPSGVGLAECERVSRALDAVLDQEANLVSGSFTLEVSSPGVNRPLAKLGDCARFAGQRAEVRTREPIGGSRRFRGILLTPVGEGDAALVRLQPETGAEVAVAWSNVADAHLTPVWPEKGQKPAGGQRRSKKKK